MKKLFPFFFLCSTFVAQLVVAQVKNPVSWSFTYKTTSSEIIIKATLEDKWHIYSQKQSGDGPLPTVFTFKVNPSFSLVGEVIEPTPVKQHSDVFGAEVMMFSKEVVFIQKIKRNSNAAFSIEGELEFMSCNDVSCLPPKTVPIQIEVPALMKDAATKQKPVHTE